MKAIVLEAHRWAGLRREKHEGMAATTIGWLTIIVLDGSLMSALRRLQGVLLAILREPER